MKHTTNPTVAICYWGMIRTLRDTLSSQKQYVYDELDKMGIEYDTYIHTWKTTENLVWNHKMIEPIDYDSIDLINPSAKQIDDQDEFTNTIHMPSYYYEGEYEWEPYLIRNHLCALESQKRSAEL